MVGRNMRATLVWSEDKQYPYYVLYEQGCFNKPIAILYEHEVKQLVEDFNLCKEDDK